MHLPNILVSLIDCHENYCDDSITAYYFCKFCYNTKISNQRNYFPNIYLISYGLQIRNYRITGLTEFDYKLLQ